MSGALTKILFVDFTKHRVRMTVAIKHVKPEKKNLFSRHPGSSYTSLCSRLTYCLHLNCKMSYLLLCLFLSWLMPSLLQTQSLPSPFLSWPKIPLSWNQLRSQLNSVDVQPSLALPATPSWSPARSVYPTCKCQTGVQVLWFLGICLSSILP